jgi:hypothetical protein
VRVDALAAAYSATDWLHDTIWLPHQALDATYVPPGPEYCPPHLL